MFEGGQVEGNGQCYYSVFLSFRNQNRTKLEVATSTEPPPVWAAAGHFDPGRRICTLPPGGRPLVARQPPVPGSHRHSCQAARPWLSPGGSSEQVH